MSVAKFGRVQLITVVCLLVVFHLATVVATAEIHNTATLHRHPHSVAQREQREQYQRCPPY